jgi:LysM repeat protein
MGNLMRRALVLGAGGLLVIALATGCTLTGAKAAPLTPVGPGTDSTGGLTAPPTAPPVEEESLPEPTEAGPIDVFGTQTAMAPLVEPETSEEVAPEESELPATEPTEEATPEPVETEETPPPAEDVTCPATHTVQAGENLYRIALKYGLTYRELAEANGIANPDKIQAGTVLTIPGCGDTSEASEETTEGEETYTVQPGDNLYRIALKFGLTWQELATYNGIENPDAIFVGQVLRIPKG